MFCAKCLEGFHLGECMNNTNTTLTSESCEYALQPDRLEKARWDEASSTVIKVLTKPCPKCRTSTERAGISGDVISTQNIQNNANEIFFNKNTWDFNFSGGCMHMICTRANCGFHWCWVCQGPWERDCMANHWFG